MLPLERIWILVFRISRVFKYLIFKVKPAWIKCLLQLVSRGFESRKIQTLAKCRNVWLNTYILWIVLIWPMWVFITTGFESRKIKTLAKCQNVWGWCLPVSAGTPGDTAKEFQFKINIVRFHQQRIILKLWYQYNRSKN